MDASEKRIKRAVKFPPTIREEGEIVRPTDFVGIQIPVW
jgi:hypothetical protein